MNEPISYSQRILELEPDDSPFIGMPEEMSGHGQGHNECRIAAAEIASEADQRIRELKAVMREAANVLQNDHDTLTQQEMAASVEKVLAKNLDDFPCLYALPVTDSQCSFTSGPAEK